MVDHDYYDCDGYISEDPEAVIEMNGESVKLKDLYQYCLKQNWIKDQQDKELREIKTLKKTIEAQERLIEAQQKLLQKLGAVGYATRESIKISKKIPTTLVWKSVGVTAMILLGFGLYIYLRRNRPNSEKIKTPTDPISVRGGEGFQNPLDPIDFLIHSEIFRLRSSRFKLRERAARKLKGFRRKFLSFNKDRKFRPNLPILGFITLKVILPLIRLNIPSQNLPNASFSHRIEIVRPKKLARLQEKYGIAELHERSEMRIVLKPIEHPILSFPISNKIGNDKIGNKNQLQKTSKIKRMYKAPGRKQAKLVRFSDMKPVDNLNFEESAEEISYPQIKKEAFKVKVKNN